MNTPKWQPIETAPKDFTMVIVSSVEKGKSLVVTAYYDAMLHATWNATTKDWDNQGAWINGGLDSYEDAIEFNPTHWMPLPAPPEVGK